MSDTELRERFLRLMGLIDTILGRIKRLEANAENQNDGFKQLHDLCETFQAMTAQNG